MIITIARQYGSGGHEIGKELASRLGLELYDRKRLEEEARKIGKFDENKDFFREKAVNSLLYSIAVSYGEANPMEKSFELIKELTHGKPAVIIGRCSGAVYENDSDATTIFLHADKDCRIKRVMERDQISEKEASKMVKEVDEKLSQYDITSAALQIESFTDELSNWYVRTNRERFWGEELTDDKIGAYTTLYKVLVNLIKISAPFVPFMTDEIYQNLVVGLDKKAPESVHLCLWPEVDEKSIDKKLENEMDLAYSLVKLGRSARNSANIKNRQPLSKMLISVDTLPEYYGNIVKEELNVKEVDLGANMNEYVHFEIKPNLPVLGKEYGKLIPKIREEISKLNQMDLANKVKNGGVEYIEIDGTQIELTSENLLVTMQGKEGFAFAGEGEIGVVLDTTITPELKEEGYVREILSKVQNMRKDKGFEVLDKINLYVSENEMLEELVKKFESEIKKETLTENIVFNTQRNTYTEVSINGEKLMLDVEVVK